MSSGLYNTAEDIDPWSSVSKWNDDPDPLLSAATDSLNLGSNNNNTNNDSHNNDTNKPSIGKSQFPSLYLTSSQLLQKDSLEPRSSKNNTISNIPQSYEQLHSELLNKLTTINDLEYHILDNLIELGYLTTYQKSRILDAVYDNDLLPITLSQNFYQILGLIALEIDVPGSGDYVTLQFRRNNLPELPEKFVQKIRKEEEGIINDPLMANSSRHLGGTDNDEDENEIKDENGNHKSKTNNDNDWSGQVIQNDPVLTDHSESQHVLSGTEPGGVGASNDIPIDTQYIEKYIEGIRDEFKPLLSDQDPIKIKEVPEKEGLLFKHINYIISHSLTLGKSGISGQKKVVRRYSDFAWLLEYLLQKYPFRVIPGLPPKKFSGASPDSQFLQRRRRGLHRFLNQLIKHPVFKEEPIVQSFLTVPTDLTTWKKQAKIDYSLEFKGRKIETDFINVIWPAISEEFLRNWTKAEQNIKSIIERWTKIVIIVERHERRQQQMSFDNSRFVDIANSFKTLDLALYPMEKSSFLQSNDIGEINSGLSSVANLYTKSSQLLIDDSFLINTKTLEKLKNYMDYLYSLQELFERSKRLSSNEIEVLNKRIKENESKFKKLVSEENANNSRSPEVTRLRQLIINDKQEIFQQLNKDWLIKQCCFKEYVMFQETQYLISEIWLEWCKDRLKLQEKLVALYDNVNNELLSDMPTSR